MIRALLIAFVAMPLAAQTPPTVAPAVAAIPKPAVAHVRLETASGPIVIEIETGRAPITSTNFLRYVAGKRLDGTSFYRAVKVQPNFGLVQGGVRFDPKRLYPPIAHEPTSKTGLTHKDGTISMARNAPGTATADFFITVGDMPSMDADPKAAGDNAGFAAFGHVIEGMDVINKLLDAPTSPTAGEGLMKGQMLTPPIKIISAKQID